SAHCFSTIVLAHCVVSRGRNQCWITWSTQGIPGEVSNDILGSRGARCGSRRPTDQTRFRGSGAVPVRNSPVFALQRGDGTQPRTHTAAIPTVAGTEGASRPGVGDGERAGGSVAAASSQRCRVTQQGATEGN